MSVTNDKSSSTTVESLLSCVRCVLDHAAGYELDLDNATALWRQGQCIPTTHVGWAPRRCFPVHVGIMMSDVEPAAPMQQIGFWKAMADVTPE
jgi:hypothetical protein